MQTLGIGSIWLSGDWIRTPVPCIPFLDILADWLLLLTKIIKFNFYCPVNSVSWLIHSNHMPSLPLLPRMSCINNAQGKSKRCSRLLLKFSIKRVGSVCMLYSMLTFYSFRLSLVQSMAEFPLIGWIEWSPDVDYVKQDMLYNVWNITSALRDSLIGKRIDVENLRQEMKLKLILEEQVRSLVTIWYIDYYGWFMTS